MLQQDTRFDYLQPLDPGPSTTQTFNPLDFLNDNAADFPPPPQQQPNTVQPTDFFRPSSAASHRSAASGVSLSSTDIDSTGYYTTDMSDDGFAPQAELASPSPLNEIGALNLNSGAPTWAAYDTNSPLTNVPQTIAPSADTLGSSVPRAGPSRNIRGVQSSKELEEKKRLDRLEREYFRRA